MTKENAPEQRMAAVPWAKTPSTNERPIAAKHHTKSSFILSNCFSSMRCTIWCFGAKENRKIAVVWGECNLPASFPCVGKLS